MKKVDLTIHIAIPHQTSSPIKFFKPIPIFYLDGWGILIFKFEEWMIVPVAQSLDKFIRNNPI